MLSALPISNRMRINRLHVSLGLTLIIIEFIGIPSGVRSLIVIIVGAVILGLAMHSVHKEYRKRHKKHSSVHDAFVESEPKIVSNSTPNSSSSVEKSISEDSHIAVDVNNEA